MGQLTMDEQQQELDDLKAEVASLRAIVQQLSTRTEPTGAASEIHDERSSRRGLLKLAGAGVAGAAVAAFSGRAAPAAAADGASIVLGADGAGSNVANTLTQTNLVPAVLPPQTGAAFVFQAGDAYLASVSTRSCALAGWSSRSEFPTGVYGFTDQSTGFGVSARASAGVGLEVSGGKATARFVPSGFAGPARMDAHLTGELIEDEGGNLWLCVADGSPGSWRKLGGPSSSGVLHAITPARVYDSRLPQQPGNGRINPNEGRVVSVATGRDQTTGAIKNVDVVPAGAQAVVYNLTVVETAGPGGFLSMVPGDVATASGSSINWFGAGQILANGGTAKVSSTRTVRVFAGGASTHFIIDVTGYYL